MAYFGGQSREQLRGMYLDTWRKFRQGAPLQPLEAQVAAVMAEHPEYLSWFESPEAVSAQFTPEAGQQNPFLHLGLHLAIREQVATNRPEGIASIHRQLAQRLGDAHAAEHAMLEPLAETLWESQRQGHAPDEQIYLEKLRKL